MRRILAVLAVVGLVVTLTGCPPTPPTGYKFTSADPTGRTNGFLDRAPGAELDGDQDDAGGGAEAPREVVEPDVIRQDGNLLYILNQYRGLMIVDLDTEAILGTAPTYGFPRDLYIANGRAYVLVGQATDYTTDGNTISFEVASRIYAVDVDDPAAPAVLDAFDLEGDLVDSRLVGDVLYAVTSAYQWYWYEDGVAVGTDTVWKQQAEEESWVTSLNVADPHNIFQADQISYDQAGDLIQASSAAIFVADHDWQTDATDIQYVDISDPAGALAVRGSVVITGHVADRYKMDAYQGVLRVVSNAWDDGRETYLTTVDLEDPDNLEVLATLNFERASGDTLFATRFDGPRAYVVTYFIIDPLFVLDLSDPANPEITGELEVPGWSTHIEPRGEVLVALGVDDTNGRKVSVSLFGVPLDGPPTLIERVSFGEEWSWSSAYSDVKSFGVLDDVLAVPFSGWNDKVGGYDRLQFVEWSPAGLDVQGFVDLQGALVRTVAYGGDYYGLTQEELATIAGDDLADPLVTNRLVLAENSTDFLPLENGLGVEVITRYDTGVTTLRSHDLPLKAAGDIELELGELRAAFADGTAALLVGVSWPEYGDGYYRYWAPGTYTAARVDYADPANPVVTGPVELDAQPYYGWWGYPMPMYDGMRAKSIAPDMWWPSYTQNTAFLVGGKLALRSQLPGEADYDAAEGPVPPQQGITVLDAETLTVAQSVGLGYDWITLVVPAGDDLLVGTAEAVNPGGFDAQPEAAHFVALFDPAAGTLGTRANVPGQAVSYDPDAGLLVLRDYQWLGISGVTAELATARWDGVGEAEKLDDRRMPEGTGRVVDAGSRVYLEVYDEGYALYAARVDAAGNIYLGPKTLVTKQWGRLVEAKDDAAYVTVGGHAIARYAFGPAGGDLTDLTEVMGTPLRIRFGTTQAYAPLGYFGVVELPL